MQTVNQVAHGHVNRERTMSHLVYSLHPIAKQSLFSTHRFATFDGDTYFETFAQLIVRGLRAEGEKAS
jgi:hypothetical protein